jgi:OmpA-OmpF porin, OOP family
MKSAMVILAVATSAVALPAAAQVNMSSVYAGGSIGSAERKDACGSIIAGGSCDEKDTAWRVFGGYQLNRNFSAELGYHHLGEITADAGAAHATSKTNLWELVGIGAFPVMNTVSLYGKLGGYRAKTNLSSNLGGGGDETNTGLTYGFGAQWDATQNLGVRAEWQRYDNVGGSRVGEGDINALTIGALYRFR